MSGGVDSSVAALLLQQQGYDVTGVFMKNWEDSEDDRANREQSVHGCSWKKDMDDVRAVCDILSVPYQTFNFVEEYRERVFSYFVEELECGRTPNPDVFCNQEIKFELFLQQALQLPNVTAVATGHFARISDNSLCRPVDQDKDQTYFLYRIKRAVLPNILFPLADLTKKEVRTIARKHRFPNADKKDSTGICFIGEIDYQRFIQQHIDPQPGDIQDMEGNVIGSHDGLHRFTLGQRKGINIGGTGPYYVAKKDRETYVLTVTNDKEDQALYHSSCTITNEHWIQDVTFPFSCNVQVRYRQDPQQAHVSKKDGTITIKFSRPQRAMTPGQSAVCYADNCVLGGGIIQTIL